MGTAARAFYLSLIANADADGCVEAGFILRATRTRKTALQELIDNGFVAMLIPDNNIVWIVNWQSFNTNDKRYGQPSHYRQTLLEHFPNIKCTPFTSKNDDNPTGNTTEDKTILDKKIPEKTIIYDINGGSDDHHNNPDFSSDNKIPCVDDVITECQKLGYVSETKTIAEQFISTNEKYHWKLVVKDNKPWIDVLKQFLGQSNYANKVNPADVRTAHIRKMEQEAEKERRRQEEAERYQDNSLYLETADDFINYIRNEKAFSPEEEVKKVALGYVFDDDELTELWDPQPMFVDESYGWTKCQFIRFDPNAGIMGFDSWMYDKLDTPLAQKAKKEFTKNADPMPELREFLEELELIPKHKEPEPFIPKTAFDDLQ